MLNYRPVFDNGLLKIFDPSSMQNSFSCEMFECFLTCTASFKSHNISMGFFLGFFFNKNCFFFSNNVLVELLVQDNPAERSTSSSPFRQITIYYLSALWYDAEFMAESLTPSCARKPHRSMTFPHRSYEFLLLKSHLWSDPNMSTFVAAKQLLLICLSSGHYSKSPGLYLYFTLVTGKLCCALLNIVRPN